MIFGWVLDYVISFSFSPAPVHLKLLWKFFFFNMILHWSSKTQEKYMRKTKKRKRHWDKNNGNSALNSVHNPIKTSNPNGKKIFFQHCICVLKTQWKKKKESTLLNLAISLHGPQNQPGPTPMDGPSTHPSNGKRLTDNIQRWAPTPNTHLSLLSIDTTMHPSSHVSSTWLSLPHESFYISPSVTWHAAYGKFPVIIPISALGTQMSFLAFPEDKTVSHTSIYIAITNISSDHSFFTSLKLYFHVAGIRHFSRPKPCIRFPILEKH